MRTVDPSRTTHHLTAYLPQTSALQAGYGFVGVALALLPLHPTARRYLAAPAPAAHN
jgi:hypothetical protein